MTVPGRIAQTLGLTEGQVYTAATGLLLAVALLALGLPGLHDVVPTTAVASSEPLPISGSPAVAGVIAAADTSPVASDGTDPEPSPTFAGAEFDTPATSPARSTVPVSDSTVVQPSPPSAAPSESTTTSAAPSAEALGVREGRYATASTPLVPAGPAGAFLPVALRVGSPDKQSYLRLTGLGTTLRLGLSTQPGHQVGTVDAIRACRIVPAAWTLEDGASLAAAPEVDPIDCTLGRPGPDGWTFDLGAIDTRNGVALVPTGPTTGSFQIVFTGPST